MLFKTVSVVGLGYIGLPTAAMFASRKLNVIGVDVNQSVVDIINKGKIHIVEPELDMLVHAAVTEGFLKATLVAEPADAFLIAVPTPFLETEAQDGIPEPDLKYIRAAAESIAKVIKRGDLIILESTSPVGATEQLAAWLAELRNDLSFPQQSGALSDIRIAHCPERVLPGHVVRELVQNDRVIGGMTAKCSELAVELYKIFVEGECVITNARTAEMAKLTENSCRDVQIAFANELSLICDKLDIDVWELISLANRHPRINILQPGPGVGGHCIAVDPWFIVSRTPEDALLIHTARKVNDSKPMWVLSKLKDAVLAFLRDNDGVMASDVIINCYGLAFKPNIDDLRESPAMRIVKEVLNMNIGRVNLIEPNIEDLPEPLFGGQLINFNEAIDINGIHLLLVDHEEFKLAKPRAGNIVDTKGLWCSDL